MLNEVDLVDMFWIVCTKISNNMKRDLVRAQVLGTYSVFVVWFLTGAVGFVILWVRVELFFSLLCSTGLSNFVPYT